ncbi:hypothetical protein CCP2SC5_620012 [Azospirillaceae bacterium]
MKSVGECRLTENPGKHKRQDKKYGKKQGKEQGQGSALAPQDQKQALTIIDNIRPPLSNRPSKAKSRLLSRIKKRFKLTSPN